MFLVPECGFYMAVMEEECSVLCLSAWLLRLWISMCLFTDGTELCVHVCTAVDICSVLCTC